MSFLRRAAKRIPGLVALRRWIGTIPSHWRARTRSREEIFADIFRRRGFGPSDSASGPGSSLEQTRFLVERLPGLLRERGVRSLLDIPCGDFHWMSRIDLRGIDYRGADVVEGLVAQNRAVFGAPGRSFVVLDLLRDPLPRVDLVICRDCLVHFSFEDCRRALAAIVASGSTYLLTTTFPGHPSNRDIPTGHWRTLSLERPPLGLPPPLEAIAEGCTEAEGAYRDKSLALWRVADLAPLFAAPAPVSR
jgi:hypothetical protein